MTSELSLAAYMVSELYVYDLEPSEPFSALEVVIDTLEFAEAAIPEGHVNHIPLDRLPI